MMDGATLAARDSAALAEQSAARLAARGRARASDLRAEGEPNSWLLGGALALGIVMILGLLLMVLVNGAVTFWPRPIEVVRLVDGSLTAGEPARAQEWRPGPEVLQTLPAEAQARIARNGGVAERTLYRIGNYDLYNEDFRWVPDFAVAARERPADMVLIERLEWGVFIGRVVGFQQGGQRFEATNPADPRLEQAHRAARARWAEIRRIERGEIGAVNHHLEAERLRLRRVVLGDPSPQAVAAAEARFSTREASLKAQYEILAAQSRRLREENRGDSIFLQDITGRDLTLPLSAVVRLFAPNDLSLAGKLGVYLSRWGEFLTDEPREANTEGGVFPAIFGTFAMTLLLVIAVAPFGIVTALYLREYARQGRITAFVRISVNNLAGVPSIVYGVFGLGFFAYILGGSIDALFFPERLPNPTFGTGGLLWASLTLALLTVPVVIVATEEALSAVPRSMREGSLACGASKWQTIRRIVLPRALPGIMTGLILAMARGAGEVAPLMLVGVVKLAPELPIDGFFPFVHLQRSFMHLGFHIYDVGFQSRNSEAGKPMVFVTTLLLIALIFVMNIGAITIRNRLKRKYQGSQF
jgi:phosphate transport system permease protein